MERMARRTGLVAIVALGGACAACSTIENIVPSPSTLASLVSFGPKDQAANEMQASAAGDPAAPKEVNCPQVEVQDGTSAMRVGGDANPTVRYQFDIFQTARECKVEGAQFAIKVGVAGRLLIGPAGSPGAYSAPLRIVVRDDASGKPVVSKLYKVEADATAASNLQAPFQLVSEPLMLPYAHKWADEDYTILVGFDTGHTPAVEKRSSKKRSH
jgi:hypothetical protein